MEVIELSHPLVLHKLSILRDEKTGTKEFRELISELATILCYEAMKDASLDEGYDSPLNEVHGTSIPYEIEVMTIPQYDTENPKMISQGPSLCIFNKDDSGEVLASWLFAQFLLTNEVQISYSQTEGYLPVTTKAQQSAKYQDYLNREGEDNELYYDVKIKAAKILLNNIENSFTTPVFNGSSALRNVAGELIEETRKATERKQSIDEAFFEKTFFLFFCRKGLDILPHLYYNIGTNKRGGNNNEDQLRSSLQRHLGR